VLILKVIITLLGLRVFSPVRSPHLVEKYAMQTEQSLSNRSSYTSRERVLEALHHKETDRIPIDLGGMASTGIMAIAYARLKEHLGLTKGEIRISDMGQQLAEVEPEILSHFGVDVISLANSLGEAPPEFWKFWKLPNGVVCKIPADVDVRPDVENGGWLIWENGIPTQRMSASSIYFS
jgi:uroporphyrinogen decarboxylase